MEINNYKEQINIEKLPRHIAIIMDGNGRWAKNHGQPRVFGHRNGVIAVREVTEAAAELGIQYLTLYAFSTENWNRPKLEVNALMGLLLDTLHKELKTLNKNNIRLQTIGDISLLPDRTRKALLSGIESTRHNTRMTLVLALNYSAKWEILEATRKLANQVKTGLLEVNQINEAAFSEALSTSGIPDPELLIRTSGETRISNFLLWQIAYAELYFTPVFWPDFRKQHFYQAIVDYQNRERRFGKISEQVAP
ncbi:MAG TPA: isoprenyl transferase [Saprospiraceae bacterium]|nr:isoprenyl transferase [Saprospiraceae bacterium]HMQ82231.1 isoprenyl transferase [Saprospiraceae bacterium]